MRRWRGTIDVPPTKSGLRDAKALGKDLELDTCYHDGLKRCKKTAKRLAPFTCCAPYGPDPWNMGPWFEGKEITEKSIAVAQELVEYPYFTPSGGEPFAEWYHRWTDFMDAVEQNWRWDLSVGIVTHNRNIQALYATHGRDFYPKLYNVSGPDFLTVHVYHEGHIAPWNGVPTPGIYLIRHAETDWGT